MALPKIDAFTGADTTLLNAYNANWVIAVGSDLVIKSNALGGSAASTCVSTWHGDTWPNDQYARMTVAANVADFNHSVIVRQAIGVSAATHYGGGIDPGQYAHSRYAIWLYNANAFTSLAVHGSTTMAAGDDVKLTVVGTTLSLYVNNMVTPLLTVSDATLASGEAGMRINSSVTNLAQIESFEGGSTAVASTRIALIGGGAGASAKIIGG